MEKSTDPYYRNLLGKSLLALAHEKLGEGAKLSQMAQFVSEKIGIPEDEAKVLIFDAT